MFTSDRFETASPKAVVFQDLCDNFKIDSKEQRYSEMRWLLSELASLCVAETERVGDGEQGLSERTNLIWEVVYTLWDSGAPAIARGYLEGKDLSAEDRKTIEDARKFAWKRHNPKRAMEEGWESEHAMSEDKQSMDEAVALYLQHEWLRHPFLDWALLDMTISREVVCFGEEVKKNYIPGKRDEIGLMHARYLKSKGNLAEMTKIVWPEVWEKLWTRVLFIFVCPIGLILWLNKIAWNGTADVILALYIVGLGLTFSFFIIRWLYRAFNRMRGKYPKHEAIIRLWGQMFDVWRLLEGPVVNPSRVKEAMTKATEKGAVWDASTWSLIDRVIGRDPAVLIALPRS